MSRILIVTGILFFYVEAGFSQTAESSSGLQFFFNAGISVQSFTDVFTRTEKHNRILQSTYLSGQDNAEGHETSGSIVKYF
jgi:hypothetical protein